jgi:hypothetical protein
MHSASSEAAPSYKEASTALAAYAEQGQEEQDAVRDLAATSTEAAVEVAAAMRAAQAALPPNNASYLPPLDACVAELKMYTGKGYELVEHSKLMGQRAELEATEQHVAEAFQKAVSGLGNLLREQSAQLHQRGVALDLQAVAPGLRKAVQLLQTSWQRRQRQEGQQGQQQGQQEGQQGQQQEGQQDASWLMERVLQELDQQGLSHQNLSDVAQWLAQIQQLVPPPAPGDAAQYKEAVRLHFSALVQQMVACGAVLQVAEKARQLAEDELARLRTTQQLCCCMLLSSLTEC